MTRQKGTFGFGSNFEPQLSQPLDARQLVDLKTDLLSINTWTSYDELSWAFKGMIVSVANDPVEENNGLYILLDDDYTLEENWKKVGTDGTLDHIELDNIGTNTHAQIDSHIDDSSVHFEIGSISHNSITDNGNNTHAQIDTHLSSTANPHSVTKTQIGLSAVSNNLQATKADFDSHTGDTSIHFGVGDISHTDITNIGTNTHAQIDTHLSATNNPHSVTKTQVGLSNVTNDAQIPLTQKGAANGVATLNGSGKVPSEQLDIQAMAYQGTWNAATNTPTLANGTGSAGDTYAVSTSGTALGQTFAAGDWAIYNGTVWEKVSSGVTVTSVAGKTGIVTLVKADVGLSNVDNVSINSWAGSANVTTLGTVGTGTWAGTTIGANRGGTGVTSIGTNKVMIGNGTSAILSPTELHWNNTNKQLGIANSTPSATLDVSHTDKTGGTKVIGKFRNPSATINAECILQLLNTSDSADPDHHRVDLNAFRTNVGGSGATDFIIKNSNGNQMKETFRIKANGNVGIGASSINNPTEKLEVEGYVKSSNGFKLGENATINYNPISNSIEFIVN